MPYRIIIFDDNEQLLNSVSMLLNLSPDFECAGTFKNCNNLIEDIQQTQPDLVLMDIDMPGLNGIEATRLIRIHFNALPVIMQTIFDENDKIFDSLRAGANGYLLKKTTPEKFLESLREALTGGAPMTGSIAAKVLNFFAAEQPAKNYHLTPREKEILELLSKGLLYKEIGDKLSIATGTVRQHIHKIYEKLHVQNRTEAINKLMGK